VLGQEISGENATLSFLQRGFELSAVPAVAGAVLGAEPLTTTESYRLDVPGIPGLTRSYGLAAPSADGGDLPGLHPVEDLSPSDLALCPIPPICRPTTVALASHRAADAGTLGHRVTFGAGSTTASTALPCVHGPGLGQLHTNRPWRRPTR
jgi:hypothetical protein